MAKVKINFYNVFFTIIGAIVVCPFIAIIGITTLKDNHMPETLLGKIIVSLLAILSGITIMMGIGRRDGESFSAKELFWGWIISSTVFVVAGFIGYGEIWLYLLI